MDPVTAHGARVCSALRWAGLLACGALACDSVRVDPVAPRGCPGIQLAQPDASSGVYVTDPDGPGGAAAAAIECEFDSGPWTVVRRDRFDAPPRGWSRTDVTTCGAFGSLLGGHATFGSETVTLVQQGLGPHTQLRLRFDIIVLDSWDGELFFVEIDGVRAHERRCDKGAPESCNQTVDECGWDGEARLDGRVSVDLTVPHTAGSVTIGFGAVLDQSPVDESWGVDNLVVSVR